MSIASANGTVISIAYSGTIDFVEEGHSFSGAIPVGTPFSGVYSYDPDGAVDVAPNDPSIGAYLFPDHIIHVEIGTVIFTSPDLAISILNSNSLFDRYSVGNSSTFTAYEVEWNSMAVDLRDATGSAFADDALPLGPPALEEFQFSRSFYLARVGQRDPLIKGEVTSLTLVPEPGTLILLLAGAGCAAGRCRGRAGGYSPNVGSARFG